MTIAQANSIRLTFYKKSNPSEEEIFQFTDALNFLIEKTNDPQYMVELGGYYYGERIFDLALKYYELAAEYDLHSAYECLGYIWYYGRTGTRDYEKAFKYFSICKEDGNIQAAYKIADMYKNGYYVEKDYDKYKEIIEELYPKVKGACYTNELLPEIFTRLANIRIKEDKKDEAIELFLVAKNFLAQRIMYNDFFGNLNIMMWLIDDLYKCKDFDFDYFDFYDMYYLLTNPCKIIFKKGATEYVINAVEEDGEFAIEFNGKWYRDRKEFFQKACINNEKLTSEYDQCYGFEVQK